jgi:hypothetical protein
MPTFPPQIATVLPTSRREHDADEARARRRRSGRSADGGRAAAQHADAERSWLTVSTALPSEEAAGTTG